MFLLVFTPYARTVPNNIPMETKLKYVLELEPGKVSGPTSFEANICYRFFDEIGLSRRKMLFEMYLAPTAATLKGISFNKSEVIISRYAKPLLWACVSVDDITVELEVIDRRNGYTVVNYTVLLSNFTAVADAYNYKAFTGLLGTPTVVKEHDAAWVYKTYTFSRLLGVKEDTNEVVDLASGTELGEWIFWLHPKDRSAKLSLLLGINYAVPYIYKSGVGFNAVLILVNSSETGSADYYVATDKTSIIISRKDTLVGHSIPFYTVNIKSTKTPSQTFTRLVQQYGCSVSKEAGIVEVSCTKLIQAYENACEHKPWAINLVERMQNGLSVKVLEIIYRKMKLIPFPLDEYKTVYWRKHGILLYIGEDTSLPEGNQGFAPPPLTSYIIWNMSAVVFKSLEAPVSLKLKYIEMPSIQNSSNSFKTSQRVYLPIYNYIPLVLLFTALAIAPLTLSLKIHGFRINSPLSQRLKLLAV